MTNLDLSYNRMSDFSNNSLLGLKNLDISGNSLTQLNLTDNRAFSLKTLYLEFNLLEGWENGGATDTSLEELDLSSNKIKAFDGHTLLKLEYLDLSFNTQLTSFKENWLPSLKRLDISQTALSEFHC